MGIRHWHRPVGVGLLLFGGTALLFALGMIVPATQNAFIDTRIGDADVAQMLWVVLVQIPLGTVVLEEVAFRGVLPALMGASPAIRWRWIPVLGASILFGLWHILPSIGIDNANAAVGGALGHNVVLTTTLAVVSMTIAGIAMCALAQVGQGHQDHDAAALGDELAGLLRCLAAAELTLRVPRRTAARVNRIRRGRSET